MFSVVVVLLGLLEFSVYVMMYKLDGLGDRLIMSVVIKKVRKVL